MSLQTSSNARANCQDQTQSESDYKTWLNSPLRNLGLGLFVILLASLIPAMLPKHFWGWPIPIIPKQAIPVFLFPLAVTVWARRYLERVVRGRLLMSCDCVSTATAECVRWQYSWSPHCRCSNSTGGVGGWGLLLQIVSLGAMALPIAVLDAWSGRLIVDDQGVQHHSQWTRDRILSLRWKPGRHPDACSSSSPARRAGTKSCP